MRSGSVRNFLYHSFEQSWIGRTLNSYESCHRFFPSHAKDNRKSGLRTLRLSIAKSAENSPLFSFFDLFFRWLFSRSLRSVGEFYCSFGVYSIVFWLFNYYIHLTSVDFVTLAYGIGLLLFSIPLFFSSLPLYEELKMSWVGRLLQVLFGIRFGNEAVKKSESHPAISMALGLAAALIAFWASIPLVLLFILAVLVICLIFRQPETGAPMICLAIPFFPTLALLGLVSVSLLSLLLKALRGKRILQLEKIDFYVFAFGCFTLFSGITSTSPKAIFPAMLYTVFLCAFFLIVTLMIERRWIQKCVSNLLWSAGIVSVIGIVQYGLGNYVGSAAWLDKSVFGDISLRAVSTLENPNMLGEYLILILPLVLSVAIHSPKLMNRFAAWALLLIMVGCLGVTFSRGAWLGAIVAFLVMICSETKHLYPALIVAGISIPLWIWVLPDVIIKRFESILIGADSSIQYRINIWKGTLRMLKDFFWGGIGTGEAAWREVYPSYALDAIEAAPHSHSLLLQLLSESGIFALIAFLFLLIVAWQSSKSARRKLNLSCELKEMTKEQHHRIQGEISLIRAFGCGIVGACVFGLFDYAWYNYRVFLLFWIILALCSACARVSQRDLRMNAMDDEIPQKADEAEIDICLSEKGEEHGVR